MSRINSSVGLITGIPIEETVKKLMEVAAKPRDLLKTRNDGLRQQQAALDTLSSRLLAFQFALNKLKSSSAFQTREVTSSKPEVLTAASLPESGTPVIGSYQVRPVRTASAHQVVSQTFASADEALSSGLLSFRTGGFVDKGVLLEDLNGGAGVPRGKIRITDRSGETATIDLSFARSIDDVIEAINSSEDISVTASAVGDALTLTDASGGDGNLRVQESGSGKTAAGLGLAGINVAADQATGSDILRLHAGTKLTTLNDGNGVDVSGEGVVDIVATLADGTELSIDLVDAVTLGDVITQINAVNPAKLSAAISDDGRRIELTDLTSGGGDFSIADGAASSAAEDLGIVATGSETIAGSRLIAGLRDTLLSRLNGGAGFEVLGEIDITDRNGATDTVNLSAAETLGDVVALINVSDAEVTASINAARNGIEIVDASGGDGNLIIANGDGTKSADAFGITVDAAVASVNSGTLGKQTIGRGTLLSSLNGGKGATLGDIKVTDSAGATSAADLNTVGSEARTVGDVIDAINALSVGVEARINDTGDGLLLTDTAGGDGTLSVIDLSGTIAKSLRLTRASQTVEIDDVPTQVINGSATSTIDLSDLDADPNALLLSSANGGQGVALGDVTIKDSRGRTIALDLNGANAGITTVSQIIDLINDQADAATGGFGVRARLNDSGTGIILEDTAGGSEKFKVTDLNSTTAKDLKIAGEGRAEGDRQVIDGIGVFAASSSSETGLEAIAARINQLEAGVTAAVVFDGGGYRLTLTSNDAGAANELLIDAAGTTLEFEESSPAEDAVVLLGGTSSPGSGVLLSSPDGKFPGAVGGADITVNDVSATPVTVTVKQTSASVVEAFEDLVEAYNSLRTDLDKLTTFNADNLTTGLLFGTNEALQVDSRLSRALTDPYRGLGDFDSLAEIGLTVDEDGKLELDKGKLQSAFAEDSDAVEHFLNSGNGGVIVKLTEVLDRLVGDDDSLLVARGGALKEKITANDERLTKFQEQLDRQQERLFLQFFQLESVIAKMQSNLTAVGNLQPLPPLVSARAQN